MEGKTRRQWPTSDFWRAPRRPNLFANRVSSWPLPATIRTPKPPMLALTSEEWLALGLSLKVGLCAVAASLPAAIGIGYFLARSKSAWNWPVELLVNLPLVLPPVVTGYLLLVCLAPTGPAGAVLERWLGVRLVFTWWAAALAAAIVSFPLMVRAIRLAFHSVDPRLEMAARTLGAGRLDAFLTITLPLGWRGLVAGSVLAFARGLGEFGDDYGGRKHCR